MEMIEYEHIMAVVGFVMVAPGQQKGLSAKLVGELLARKKKLEQIKPVK